MEQQHRVDAYFSEKEAVLTEAASRLMIMGHAALFGLRKGNYEEREKALAGMKQCKDDSGIFCGVKVAETETGSISQVACDGLFVAIGLIPENGAFADLADLNAWGYFDSGENCETRTPGIYAAGDCRSKTVRQLTTAAGDGATAALAACRYIDAMG